MRLPTRPSRLLLALVAAGVISGACGSSSDTTTTAPTAPAPSVSPSPPPTGSAVKLGEAKLGQVLVGTDGRTLYGFTNDTDAKSTCSGACALAWPPAVVDATWAVGPGLDTAVFATTQRDDGTLQLVAGKWPLYYFEGDAAAGDTHGQGSGDVWFAVAPDAKLVKSGTATTPGYGRIPDVAAAPAQATVRLVDSTLGPIVADATGRTLYAFTKDDAGTPTCTGGCATAWPSAPAPATLTAGDGIDGAKLTAVARPDGAADQLKLGKWPLYYFAGDGGPGDFNGQGSGGVWFMVKGDGTLAKS
jgi:predicted lipoprotein with Yx(FWY)xxD motif